MGERVLRGSIGIPLLLLLISGLASAEPKEASDWEYDRHNAQDVLETCAGCHGKNAAGDDENGYPRLAGLKEKYIVRQLEAFKGRTRVNIPMDPYASERELPADDVRDVARLLSTMELQTAWPVLTPEMTSYERLLATQAVFNVPTVEGDLVRGAELFDEECSDCHGEQGWGEDDAPQLAGQHTNYLRKQVAAYQSGKRINEDMDGVFEGLEERELEDIWAFLSTRDD